MANARIVERQPNGRWPTLRELELEFTGALPALGKKKDVGKVLTAISPIWNFRILNEDDIKAELIADRYLLFTLSAKDALSGTTVV